MTFEQFEAAMDKDCRRCTQENIDDFNAIVAKLGGLQPGDHFFCGPHSYLAMKLAVEIVKPKAILEIGFNLGHSSLFWLTHSKASVVSLDIRHDDRMAANATICAEHGDFKFINRETPQTNTITAGQFDMAFIDGSHQYKDVVKDIAWCRELKIPYLFMDDWMTIYGGVQRAVFDSGLKIVFISSNQVLIDATDKYCHRS